MFVWTHFLPRVLQFPGNGAEFRSDKKKHRRPNSPPLILSPSFGFGGTLDFPVWQILGTPRNHFSPAPMNQIYLHCLHPDTADLHEGFIWQNAILDIGGEDAASGGHLYSWEGGPIPQSSKPPSFLPIVYLNIISRFFPNTGKNVRKSSIRLSPSL